MSGSEIAARGYQPAYAGSGQTVKIFDASAKWVDAARRLGLGPAYSWLAISRQPRAEVCVN